jgi:hypothetical protein
VSPMSEGPSQKISKGKLPDRYRNRRKSLKAAGIVTSLCSVQHRDESMTAGNATSFTARFNVTLKSPLYF